MNHAAYNLAFCVMKITESGVDIGLQADFLCRSPVGAPRSKSSWGTGCRQISAPDFFVADAATSKRSKEIL